MNMTNLTPAHAHLVPLGPLQSAPAIPEHTLGEREAARELWHDALRGLPLGEYDQQIVGWAAETLGPDQLVTLASLVERARIEGGGR
ncbi:hypothetical protein [Nonomuraea soli]|uniref:Uncharacterized protein n=1 Tax=Nonomuraea soli TaxID=1032476 RepID=A0A7W0CUF1_9ACTN|nr:hypothetical protein [Nonomuraea soli]MBA2897359.1 hypothetical protein [Nonomuraea soli]